MEGFPAHNDCAGVVSEHVGNQGVPLPVWEVEVSPAQNDCAGIAPMCVCKWNVPLPVWAVALRTVFTLGGALFSTCHGLCLGLCVVIPV